MDYQLTRDGRYMIRIYQQNQYEGVIQGQVVETGASFILTFDYNKLRELFRSRKEKKEIKQKPLENKSLGCSRKKNKEV